MRYEVRLGAEAHKELLRLPAYHRTRLIAAMQRELVRRPTLDEKPRKRLAPDPDSGIPATAAVWQLRVGDFRIFYDVDEKSRTVMVQRIARKGRRTTGEVLR